jgi:hypothetical protein
MPKRRECVDGVAERHGVDPSDVDDDLKEMLDRADGLERDGMSYEDALRQAGLDMIADAHERARFARRAAMMDERKNTARRRYYRETVAAIEKNAPNLARDAPGLALEAKLVGVNLPFLGNRKSIDAQYVALRRQIIGGFESDLERSSLGDLSKLFASRQIEKEWTDELAELWKKEGGKPGVTKNPQALEIAKTVLKWQKSSIDQLNREGAWVRSYSGYVTKTSHDADRIRAAGPEAWAAYTLDRLDLKRTFGTTDKQRAMDALRAMWDPFARGDHFDYAKAVYEPISPSMARRASAERELHFKDAAAWRDYNESFGVRNPTMTVVEAMRIAARRIALMREFGTKPQEAFEADLAYWKSWEQGEGRQIAAEIEKLKNAPGAPADAKDKIAQLEAKAQSSAERFRKFGEFEQGFRNRFAQIDGTSMKPVNRALSNVVNNWMSIQRMAKPGRVFATHFASLPTKSAEARYWGIPFGERMTSLFRGLTSGIAGSDRRHVLDMTLVAFENRLGHMMAQYDVADAPHGLLAKWESTFFKLTGVSTVIDNQRGDAEAMFAAHVGSKRGEDWAAIGRKEQRVLQGFGIGESEWKALHGVDWTNVGGRTYLFPSDVMKLSDDQVRAYIEAQPRQTATSIGPEQIARERESLALAIATAYTDRSGFAIPMPDARTRAMMFGKNFEPGTAINTALRLIYQFKVWPAVMISRAWGREIYGRPGDGAMDRIVGLAELLVGAAFFGVAAETLRKTIQGQDGLAYLRDHPVAAIGGGLQRSGMGTLAGDFLLGEYDRHGLSAVADLAGPTFSQIDNIMSLIHAEKDSPHHPWRERAAVGMKIIRDNTPFMNLWATSIFMNYLVWYRLQDWINPGYLARTERRMRDQQGVQFWLSPQHPAQSLGML